MDQQEQNEEFEDIELDPEFWTMSLNFGRRLYKNNTPEIWVTWKKNYDNYIASRVWKDKAKLAVERAGGRCQLCYSDKKLIIHHRTCERLGCELDSDLTVLCSSCHAVFYRKEGE